MNLGMPKNKIRKKPKKTKNLFVLHLILRQFCQVHVLSLVTCTIRDAYLHTIYLFIHLQTKREPVLCGMRLMALVTSVKYEVVC